jgi:hypothetical protein
VTSLDPVTAWTGWDVRGGTKAPPQIADAFARTPLQDVGEEAHYELIAVTGRGFRPPRFLTAVEGDVGRGEMASWDARSGYEGLRQAWSLLYRRVAETTPAAVVPYAIYLLGVNAPTGATSDELEVFNDFYTNVHLPEVAERRHALRAVRYELLAEVRPPYQGAPRFLAVYEVDEQAAAVRRHVGPPYSSGPEVWQRHTTPWRLWYRRLVGIKGVGQPVDPPG